MGEYTKTEEEVDNIVVNRFSKIKDYLDAKSSGQLNDKELYLIDNLVEKVYDIGNKKTENYVVCKAIPFNRSMPHLNYVFMDGIIKFKINKQDIEKLIEGIVVLPSTYFGEHYKIKLFTYFNFEKPSEYETSDSNFNTLLKNKLLSVYNVLARERHMSKFNFTIWFETKQKGMRICCKQIGNGFDENSLKLQYMNAVVNKNNGSVPTTSKYLRIENKTKGFPVVVCRKEIVMFSQKVNSGSIIRDMFEDWYFKYHRFCYINTKYHRMYCGKIGTEKHNLVKNKERVKTYNLNRRKGAPVYVYAKHRKRYRSEICYIMNRKFRDV